MRPEKEISPKNGHYKKDYDEKYEEDYHMMECDYKDYDKKSEKKLIQTKVIKGKGSDDFFIEADFTIPDATGQGSLYLIESVTTWVEVYDAKVVCDDKVIFNAWVYKNIIYKGFGGVETPGLDEGVTVTGPVQHITKAIPLAGCINIDTKKCEKLNPCEDIAEVIKARVIGEVDDKLDEIEVDNSGVSYNPPVYTYGRVHEKMCVRIEVKVVRWEHLSIEIQDKC